MFSLLIRLLYWYGGKCYKNITDWINYDTSIYPEPSQCKECKENFFCLGDDKTKCLQIDNIELYYSVENNACVKLCRDTYTNWKKL